MPKQIDPAAWDKYFALRDSLDSGLAAQKAGISRVSAWRLENVPGYGTPAARAAYAAFKERNPTAVIDTGRLNVQARKCLDDFAAFRLRYFGRKSTPWQIHAANQTVEALKRATTTLDPQYLVINVAPGSGKSEMFGHDLIVWLICRDRSITVFIGSAGVELAGRITEEIMTTLEATSPVKPNTKQKLRGAVDAQACLLDDYGRFKPDNGRNWSTKAFKVVQPDNAPPSGKEATVAAVGANSNYLGMRPDLVIWDDLVNEETSGTPESRAKLLRKYQREAEPRVELGGVMILQGQRQFAEDLYHSCINARGGDENNPEDLKYTHIVYKAHYDEHCRGDHGKTAQPYDPANPTDSGCLLDPLGVSWHRLTEVRLADERDGSQNYRIVYQQEDGDPTRALVNPLWIDGGEDPKTGERFGGCWDDNRVAGVVPKLLGDTVNALSVDSSPSKFWAIGWWMYHPDTERRFLVDLHRAKMRVTDALAYNKDSGIYSGLFEGWWVSAQRQNRPITHLIFEAVAAERYFLDSPDLIDWARSRGVQVLKHDTHRNKTDPQYGMQGLLPPVYRLGRVRLAGETTSGSRAKMMPLVREVTRWPDTSTEDCAVQHWFFEHNLPHLLPRRTDIPNQRRPSVLKTLPDGRGLRLLVGAR